MQGPGLSVILILLQVVPLALAGIGTVLKVFQKVQMKLAKVHVKDDFMARIKQPGELQKILALKPLPKIKKRKAEKEKKPSAIGKVCAKFRGKKSHVTVVPGPDEAGVLPVALPPLAVANAQAPVGAPFPRLGVVRKSAAVNPAAVNPANSGVEAEIMEFDSSAASIDVPVTDIDADIADDAAMDVDAAIETEISRNKAKEEEHADVDAAMDADAAIEAEISRGKAKEEEQDAQAADEIAKHEAEEKTRREAEEKARIQRARLEEDGQTEPHPDEEAVFI